MAGQLALFIQHLYRGGAERVMANLANGLAARGWDVDVVVLRLGPHTRKLFGSMKPFPLSHKVRLVELAASRAVTAIPALARYLRKERPRALLSSLEHVNCSAIAANLLSGHQTSLYIATHAMVSQKTLRVRGWRGRLLEKCLCCLYPRADGIIAVSRGAASALASHTGISYERIKVIYNPVIGEDIECRKLAEPDHQWLRDKSIPVVVGAGRFLPEKDFESLIRAFAIVRDQRPVRLVIFGDGEERGNLETLVASLGLTADVSLPGFTDNLFSALARSAAFVLTSKWEALPTVVIEALACGVPVVATDCPCGPREILADGRYGTLVPLGNIRAIADGIEKVFRGDCIQPPPESWAPYHVGTAVEEYERVLLGLEQRS